MKTKYHSFSDSGHGWLRVEKAELVELGIADQITRYSYQRGKYAYLEEDRDLSTFIQAKEKQGVKVVMHHYTTDRRSKIRGYESYECQGQHETS